MENNIKIKVKIIVKYEGPDGEARYVCNNWDEAVQVSNYLNDKFVGFEKVNMAA